MQIDPQLALAARRYDLADFFQDNHEMIALALLNDAPLGFIRTCVNELDHKFTPCAAQAVVYKGRQDVFKLAIECGYRNLFENHMTCMYAVMGCNGNMVESVIALFPYEQWKQVYEETKILLLQFFTLNHKHPKVVHVVHRMDKMKTLEILNRMFA